MTIFIEGAIICLLIFNFKAIAIRAELLLLRTYFNVVYVYTHLQCEHCF